VALPSASSTTFGGPVQPLSPQFRTFGKLSWSMKSVMHVALLV
jgi:hypothetical protein